MKEIKLWFVYKIKFKHSFYHNLKVRLWMWIFRESNIHVIEKKDCDMGNCGYTFTN